MSARDEMAKRGWNIIRGEHRAEEREWTTIRLATARGLLIYEKRFVPGPDGGMRCERRGGRIDGQAVSDDELADLVTLASMPHVVSGRRFTGD